MFEIDSFDAESKTVGWSKGGFQGARGNNKGGEWYAENIYEARSRGSQTRTLAFDVERLLLMEFYSLF